MAPSSQAKLMVRLALWGFSPLIFYLTFVILGLPVTILGAVGVIPRHPEGWLRNALLAFTLVDLLLSVVVVWMLWRKVYTSWPFTDPPRRTDAAQTTGCG